MNSPKSKRRNSNEYIKKRSSHKNEKVKIKRTPSSVSSINSSVSSYHPSVPEKEKNNQKAKKNNSLMKPIKITEKSEVDDSLILI